MNRRLAASLPLVAALLGPAVGALGADLTSFPAEPDTLAIGRPGAAEPLLVYHAPPDARPYVHPLRAPDGVGVLTEFSPGHHPHQTGLYLGFLRVNGRDYFHNRGADSFRRTAFVPATPDGDLARWSASYDWLGADGAPVLRTTQLWSLLDRGDHLILDLDWTARAAVPVTFGEYDYGGLFLRMPWTAESGGSVLNSEGDHGFDAEGQRARWVEVSMPISGRDDDARIAILDHPANPRHPVPWRVDGQLGIGPSPSRAGDWSLAEGETVRLRYRLVVGTGDHDAELIEAAWRDFAEEAEDR